MIRHVGAALAALALAAGCSTTDEPAAAPAPTSAAAPTSAGFPEPRPYTHTIDGEIIRVRTSDGTPENLFTTYNSVARTLRGTLDDGGYRVQIECEATGERLANGTIGVGKLGAAQVGNFGEFGGTTGATCP